MKGFALTVLAVDRVGYEGTAVACVVESTTGSRTLEAHHEPFVAVLGSGTVVIVEEGGRRQSMKVEDGLVHFEKNCCIIVATLGV